MSFFLPLPFAFIIPLDILSCMQVLGSYSPNLGDSIPPLPCLYGQNVGGCKERKTMNIIQEVFLNDCARRVSKCLLVIPY